MTLIETLIVITILGILAELLLPVFRNAREKARSAACQSNLKQLGTAFQMYLSDWDDQYPGAAPLNPEDMNPGWTRWGQWVYVPDKPPNNLPIDVTLGALYPYVKNEQVYLCPSAYYNRSKRLSYSMNLNLTFAWEGKIGDSSSTILLIDESKDLNDGWFSPGCPYGAPGTDMATVIHNSGSNYLFCDGHVKWVKPGSPLVDTCLQPGPFYP